MNFTASDERLAALWQSLSHERLERYVEQSDRNHSAALSLYEQNLRLASAFYVPLQCFEITLRNTLHNAMCDGFGDDWLQRSETILEEGGHQAIKEAISNLKGSVSQGSIVAKLNFGFWVSLLASGYSEKLWRRFLYSRFRNGSKYLDQKTVHGRINAMRRFRNRVAHHEPIIFRDLKRTHEELIETLSWMCPITAEWAAQQSEVPKYLRDSPN